MKALKRLRALKKSGEGEEERLLLYADLLMGRCLQRQGKSSDAHAAISQSVRCLEGLNAPRETALGYHYLSQLNAARSDAQAALECCMRGMEIAKRARDWYLQMNLHIDMCPVQRAMGDFEAGIDSYLRGKEIFLKHLKGKDASVEGVEEYTEFIINLNIAVLYLNLGKHDKSLEYLDMISDSVDRVLGGAYIDQYHIEYAHACLASGRVEEGARHTDIVIGRLEADQDRSLHNVPMNCINLCVSLVKRGLYERTIHLLDLIRESVERSKDVRVMASMQRAFAFYYEATGERDKALEAYGQYAELVDQYEQKRYEDSRRSTERRMALQQAVDKQKRLDEARERDMLRLKQEMEYKTEREAILTDISENTDTFFLLYSPKRATVDFVSGNALRLFGFDVENANGLCNRLFDWLSIDREDARRFIAGELYDRVSCDYEANNPKTGEMLTVHLEMIPSSAKRSILVLSDVTSIMKTQDSLITAIVAAQQASAAKTVFLSNMSHDIRTPLNAILGLFDMMEDNLRNPEATANYLAMARQSSRHLLALINDVLDMSRIEAGRVSLAAEPFCLPVFLEGVMNVMRPQAQARGQTLTLEKTGVTDDLLIGDSLRLRQVFFNILGNAVKFTPAGGSITLRVLPGKATAAGREGYVFEFIDTGCGMTPEFLRKVFTPFERAENEVRAVEGTGLGMAITKSIVDMMSGDLSVKSVPGEGTTFTLTVDFERKDGARAAQKTLPHARGARRGSGVALLVEDNALNTMIAKYQLEKLGYTVVTAVNGQEAVEMFGQSKPGQYCVILMDVRMPLVDGYEATRRIRRLERPDAREIPIIAMTADAFEEDVRKALDAGMNAHIAKPLDMTLLADTLYNI